MFLVKVIMTLQGLLKLGVIPFLSPSLSKHKFELQLASYTIASSGLTHSLSPDFANIFVA